MTGLHAALAALVGEKSGAGPVRFGGWRSDALVFVEEIRALLDEHPADLPVATDNTTAEIEDGFGGAWTTCGPDCDLQVVRPGKVQCNHTSSACPDAPAPEPSDRAGLSETEREEIAREIRGLILTNLLTSPYAAEAGKIRALLWLEVTTFVADRLAVAEQERAEERGDLLRAGEEWMGDALRAEARAEAAEQEVATLRAQVAALWDLPARVARRVHEHHCGAPPSCGDARDCAGRVDATTIRAIRQERSAALGDSAQVVQQIKDEAAADALEEAAVELDSHVCTEPCSDMAAGAPCPYADAARIVRERVRRVWDGGDHG